MQHDLSFERITRQLTANITLPLGAKVSKNELVHKEKKFSDDRHIDHFDVKVKRKRRQELRTRHDNITAIVQRLRELFGDVLPIEELRQLGGVLVVHPNACRDLCEARNYRSVVSLLREDELWAAARVVEKLASLSKSAV